MKWRFNSLDTHLVLSGLESEGRSLQDGSFDALQKMTRVHSL